MPIDCAYSGSRITLETRFSIMLKRAIIARVLHKWLGLLVGLQILIWLSSGLYMVIVSIDFIHGDSLVKNMQEKLSASEAGLLKVSTVQSLYPDATEIELKPVMGKTHYLVSTGSMQYLLNAQSGDLISPLDEKAAKQIALYHFNGDDPVSAARLIESEPPMEVQTRRLPLWRIDFDDRYSTSFYIDPYSGSLVTRRFQYWRIFDFMWMLHIMDYDQRSDAHNRLLISAQIAGLIFSISGLWLLFYSFSGRRRKKAGQS